jgi:hemoglobin-like flavoprotein
VEFDTQFEEISSGEPRVDPLRVIHQLAGAQSDLASVAATASARAERIQEEMDKLAKEHSSTTMSLSTTQIRSNELLKVMKDVLEQEMSLDNAYHALETVVAKYSYGYDLEAARIKYQRQVARDVVKTNTPS